MVNNIHLLKIPTLLFVIGAFFMSACSSSTSSGAGESELEVYMAEDIPANPSGSRGGAPDFTFYSLKNNTIVDKADSASVKWDLAFNATTILVNSGASGPGNGGAIVVDQAFENTDLAPVEGYKTDTDTSFAISDWYRYDMSVHAVLPKTGKTIVLKTADGEHYAKVQILSYYKGNPDTSSESFQNRETRPEDRYYTFEYAIQLNGSNELN